MSDYEGVTIVLDQSKTRKVVNAMIAFEDATKSLQEFQPAEDYRHPMGQPGSTMIPGRVQPALERVELALGSLRATLEAAHIVHPVPDGVAEAMTQE